MTIDTPNPVERPQRADARRNREKIVEAARAAFAETGLATQMDDIARRAGVGVGTVYRHFPDKDAIVAGIVEARMRRIAGLAQEALDRGGDPWEALAGFLRTAAEVNLSDRAMAEVMASYPASSFQQIAGAVGLRDRGAELVRRAREAGAVRSDASVSDIPLMMCGVGAVRQSWGEEGARRYLALMLDGLRNGPAGRSPG